MIARFLTATYDTKKKMINVFFHMTCTEKTLSLNVYDESPVTRTVHTTVFQSEGQEYKKTQTSIVGPKSFLARRHISKCGDATLNNDVTTVGDTVYLQPVHKRDHNPDEDYKNNRRIKAINAEIASILSLMKGYKSSDPMAGLSWKQRLNKRSEASDSASTSMTFAEKIRSTRTVEQEWQRTLFIDNIPDDYTQKDLLELLSGCDVQRVNIVKDRESGDSRGKAFAVLDSEQSVFDAIKMFNRTRIGNQLIMVQQALPKK